MNNQCGVYAIKNILDNKFYVGSSKSISRRYSTHIRLLRGNCHHSYKLQEAWNRTREESFSFSVLELCDEVNLRREDVMEIRSLILAGKSVSLISLMFGISKSTVYSIKYGKIWRGVR